MGDVLYFNGRFTTTDEPVISVEDRGFQFGDAIYEMMKFVDRRVVFLPDHYRRMKHGLDAIEIPNPWPSESEFRSMCIALIERTAFGTGMLYVQVTRGESRRAHFYPEEMTPTAIAYTREFRFPDAGKKEKGIAVITTEDLRWKLCSVKTVNLLPNALAKKKAQRAGAEEALFLSGDEVSEGASSSFFIVSDGRLVTHPSSECILPGTVRDRVISIALREKIRVDERPVRDFELFNLQEAFITSTSQGVMPVTTIDGRPVGNCRAGEITARLQKLLDAEERSDVLSQV